MGKKAIIMNIKNIQKVMGRGQSTAALLLANMKKDTKKKFITHVTFCKYTGIEVELVESILEGTNG